MANLMKRWMIRTVLATTLLVGAFSIPFAHKFFTKQTNKTLENANISAIETISPRVMQPAHKFFTKKTNEKEVMQYIHTNPISDTVPPNLIGAVCWQESRFDQNAENPEPHLNDVSYGLMQILKTTARELDGKYSDLPSLDQNLDGKTTDEEVINSLKTPLTNLRYGTRILEENKERYVKLDLVVAAYNAGPLTPGNASFQYQLNEVVGTSLDCDGLHFGESKKAIKEFQREYGLDIDGRAGPNTQTKLKELYQNKFKKNPPVGLIPRNRKNRTKKHTNSVMDRFKYYNRKYPTHSDN